MITQDFRFASSDGLTVHGVRWLPEPGQSPRAVVQIAHGMAEHCRRYARLAEFLCARGYAVYAHDHRGHGFTAGAPDRVGYLAEKDGFFLMVDDVYRVNRMARDENPGLKVFLLGHSMGSFVAQSFLQSHGEDLDGCILSGTNGKQGFFLGVAARIAAGEVKKKGRRAPSPRLTQMSFGSFNKAFRPNRTAFDWLSRDPAEVDKYAADPYCGAVFSAGFFVDFLAGLRAIEAKANLRKVPLHVPVYLFSGALDPVGAQGKGPTRLAATYRSLGLTSVELKLYPEARHETLNETNRDQVMADLVGWLDLRLK